MTFTEEELKRFDEEFGKFLWWVDDLHCVDVEIPPQVKNFISESHARLLEWVEKEIFPKWINNPLGDASLYIAGRRDERKDIRAKLKEIRGQDLK